ncbi:MAG: polysaccharide biosynthesis/export family protein [Bacteroidetes bacterium]|nr:polysaccharide biosynthesis/export family protein [Bacteroidota bacterium]
MRNLFFMGVVVIILSSCGKTINPSIMFKTPSDFPYTTDQTIGNVEYRIAPFDIIEFSLFSNDGEKLIERSISSGNPNASFNLSNNQAIERGIQYDVDLDGNVKLPQIGKIKIKEMTISEAEKMLEEKYSVYYKKPFAIVNVINRRVIVFTGTGGLGRVIPLQNENTTLIEAIAIAGGITQTGKARKIKLIRGDTRNPQIQLIDLSTVEGLRQSNLLLQANDIIYVEPVPRLSQGILAEVAPIVGIITSGLLIYNFINQINSK